jgi:ABC-type amino acid transport substrate-binding protein
MNIRNITFLGLLLGLLTACDDTPKTAAVQETDLKGQKLVMTTSPDNPPFESFDSVKREVLGFDVDLARLIAQDLGATLEIMEQDFSALIPSIQAHKADFAMAQFSATPERANAVDFSTPYLTTAGALVVLESANITSPQDLQGKLLGAQLGSTFAPAAEMLSQKIPGLQVKLYNKAIEMMEDVKNGRIQAALIDQTTGQDFAKAHTQLRSITLDDAMTTQTLCIVLPKGSTKREAINGAIMRLEKAGEIAKLKGKWLK